MQMTALAEGKPSVTAPAVLQDLAAMPRDALRAIRGIFTDIDDTLSSDGRLTAEAYAALSRAAELEPDNKEAARLLSSIQSGPTSQEGSQVP